MVSFVLNGRSVDVEASDEKPLLDVLRNRFGLTGAHYGCGAEQCGACVVLVEGAPAYSCGRPLGSVAGKQVTSVEGLGTPETPHPLQAAFIAEQAGQCGYCLPGILMASVALLERNPAPTRAEVALALDPHLCRCGAHNRIIRAVQRAGRMRQTAPA